MPASRGQTAECTEKNFDNIIGINLKGAWLGMKHEIGQMLRQGGGAIVNNAGQQLLCKSAATVPLIAICARFLTASAASGEWPEALCAENPHFLGTDARFPTADTPDF